MIIVGVVLYFVVRTTGIFSHKTSSKVEQPSTVEAAVEDEEPSSEEKADDAPQKEEESVPNFVGLKKEEAEKLLEKTSLKAEYTYQYSKIEKDYIIDQSIDADTKITENLSITLTISQGEEPITMPNVVGMEMEQAKKELEALGIQIEYSYQYSVENDVNKILNQSVEFGDEIIPGQKVTLIVSLGKEAEKAIVPDLKYYTKEEAKVQLERLGFVLGEITEQNSDIIAKGQIISQSIDAKQKAEKGTKIDVVISSGVEEEKYVYRGNITIASCPFSTEEKENADLTLILVQKEKEKVFYDGLVTEKDFPLSIDFDGTEEGEALVRVEVDGEEIKDSYIVQINKVEK